MTTSIDKSCCVKDCEHFLEDIGRNRFSALNKKIAAIIVSFYCASLIFTDHNVTTISQPSTVAIVLILMIAKAVPRQTAPSHFFNFVYISVELSRKVPRGSSSLACLDLAAPCQE